MDDTAAGETQTESIDSILSRVRAEVAGHDQTPESVETQRLRRQGALGSIPMIEEIDDSEAIELGRPYYTIEEFLALDEEACLNNAYRVLLGRDMDKVGRGYYLPALRDGHISVVRLLSSLRHSPEGQARGVTIRWLKPAALLDRLANKRVIGKFVAPLIPFLVRSQVNRRLMTGAMRHAELISATNTALSAIRKNQAHIEMRMNLTERDAAASRDSAQNAMDDAGKALAEIRATRQLITEESVQLARLIAEARAVLPQSTEPRTLVESMDDHALDSLYVAFENRFRGSTAEIGKRSERYLPVFRQTEPVAAGAVVLDIGCGRGEWLALLNRSNITTRGIDLNGAMVAEARALGLDVLEGDAIAYLRSLPENSLAAVTGFHIVEHLAFKDLVTLFDEARRALMPGGIILFETPNPENLVVGACTFNYDPTHNKPLPPDLLRFIAEARGYTAARIIRSDADCQLDQPETGFAPTEINDWFRQPPDYAVYAQKPASLE